MENSTTILQPEEQVGENVVWIESFLALFCFPLFYMVKGRDEWWEDVGVGNEGTGRCGDMG